ncbi:hypothetical protein K505DRAFT_338494 [Melanomma pulvis-pyrius CBS 109.77]|uniref:MYND-type domain-containing protein n=1 Tax=Melanomma pulvis-pyrius CBS 109.77 TaxID=1314802 RepID=A0A6A6X8S8_9PLEO|nr:hypothetical protein K505DRAFT_338494 [Melanomma pulvis-pyrius CBS 109.77]
MTYSMPTSCANCGETGVFRCSRCTMVAYCHPNCEKAYLSVHENDCKALLEKAITRIAGTWKAAFLIFRENVYTVKTKSVSQHQNKIIVQEADNDVSKSGEVLFRFPRSFYDRTKDQHAVLSAYAGEDPVGYLHDFLVHMIKGAFAYSISRTLSRLTQTLGIYMTARIREQKVSLHDPACATLLGPDKQSKVSLQHVLFIQARAFPNSWILDPAGAAYGIDRASMSTTAYANFVEQRVEINEFGTQRQLLKGYANIPGLCGLPFRLSWLAMDRFQAGVAQWKGNANLDLVDLIWLPDEQFVIQQRHLLANISTALADFRLGAEYREEISKTLLWEERNSGKSSTMAVITARRCPKTWFCALIKI